MRTLRADQLDGDDRPFPWQIAVSWDDDAGHQEEYVGEVRAQP
jgi:hypothetical protein